MRKGTILAIVLVILLSAGAGAYYYFYMNEESENLELEAGWNDVTFTQGQIDACPSDVPEDVFASILIVGNEVSVYQTQNEVTKSWSTELPSQYNTLKEILPDIRCDVHVTISCTLTIG